MVTTPLYLQNYILLTRLCLQTSVPFIWGDALTPITDKQGVGLSIYVHISYSFSKDSVNSDDGDGFLFPNTCQYGEKL